MILHDDLSVTDLPVLSEAKDCEFFDQPAPSSAAVTLLGTIWPQGNYENPSANTCLTSTGGLEISEVHGVGYKLLSSTPLLLIVYLFLGQVESDASH